MPKNKDLKRLIRARMQKTGESYTAARARVLSSELPLPKDYAEVAGMSDAAVRKATGRDWQEWTTLLDAEDAASWEHRRIARWLHDTHAVSSWWSQMVTVAYERFRGLRDVGQRRGGGFEMSKSRTVRVSMDALKAAFESDELRRRWLPELPLEVVPTRSKKSVVLSAANGVRISAWFVPKGNDRAAVSVQRGGFETRAEADAERELWHGRLDRLKAELETPQA